MDRLPRSVLIELTSTSAHLRRDPNCLTHVGLSQGYAILQKLLVPLESPTRFPKLSKLSLQTNQKILRTIAIDGWLRGAKQNNNKPTQKEEPTTNNKPAITTNQQHHNAKTNMRHTPLVSPRNPSASCPSPPAPVSAKLAKVTPAQVEAQYPQEKPTKTGHVAENVVEMWLKCG